MTDKDNDLLYLELPTKEALYQAYMPYIKDGALFIKTAEQFALGDDVLVLLKLLDEPDKYSIAGKVVWITPPGHGVGRQGIGVQFTHDGAEKLRDRIETYLVGLLNSSRPTDTM